MTYLDVSPALLGKSLYDETAAEAARASFQAHPGRVLVVDRALSRPSAARLNAFFGRNVEFTPSFGLYSANGAVGPRRWHAAPTEDRMFRFRMMTASTFSALRETFDDLETWLTADDSRDLFEALTGERLGPPSSIAAYAYGKGDFLRPHSDRVGRRKLAFIFYLGRGWSPGDGGELRFTLRDGTRLAVRPLFNRLVLFDLYAHRRHEVLPVTGPNVRYTVSGWRCQPEP